ncbi:MAG: OsmC family protein [Anaerolineales bacterium]|jgi:uncharacterized OsmC-like protein
MAEKVIVIQNDRFETGFWAVDPNQPESVDFEPVEHLHQLTPYGMLLASVASCTAQVVHSYAHHHDIALDEVELHEAYQRNYQEDSENSEGIDRYEECIEEQIAFIGDLTEDEGEKLFKIAHQCPIMKMVETGTEIKTELVEPSGIMS